MSYTVSLRLVLIVVLVKVGLLRGRAGTMNLTVIATLLLNSRFKLHIGLFLNCLGCLEFLDQLHLEHLHLHHLLLSLGNGLKFLLNLLLNLHSGILDFPALLFINLLTRDLFLHLDCLLFVLILLLHMLHLLLKALLVLLSL